MARKRCRRGSLIHNQSYAATSVNSKHLHLRRAGLERGHAGLGRGHARVNHPCCAASP